MSKTFKKFKNEGITNAKKNRKAISRSDRDAKIAELAYYQAESGHFLPGQAGNDWQKAERKFSF